MTKAFINLPVAHYDDVLSWDQATIDRLIGHVYEVAMKVGCHVDAEEYLAEIESNGGTVDWDRHALVPTRRQLDEVCEILTKAQPMEGHLRSDPIRGNGFAPVQVGNGGNLFFDWESWTAKAPAVEDLIWTCRWAQGNEDVESLFAPFMLKDLDIVLEPMYSFAVMARYCRKKIYHAQPTEPIHVKYLDRMARIVEKHRGYYQEMQQWEWVNPPFRISDRAIRTMLARVDLGVCDTMGIGPMTVSGMRAPVTVAGAAVVAVAEVLTALNVLHLLRSQANLGVSCVSGELDLATARVKYFSFRGHKQNLAIPEIFRRGLGVQTSSYFGYREANEPGLQACYEYGCAQAFFSALKSRMYPEVGGLCCGNMWSPEQAIMDIEMIKEFEELISGFDASDEAVAVDEIIAAGFEQGHHMASEHTLKHMREHIAASDFFLRGYPAGAEHDRNNNQTRKLMDRARAMSLACHRKGAEREPDDALGDELWACVEEAAAELGVEAPDPPVA